MAPRGLTSVDPDNFKYILLLYFFLFITDLVVAQVIQRTYAWETINSPSPPPNDSGSVAVFDGSKLL